MTAQLDPELRSLLDLAPDGIFVADLDGRYVLVNHAACRMLGYSREELLGKTIVDLIPPEDEPRLWESRRAMLQGGLHLSEWRLRHKDGSYLPVEVHARILADGRWQGFVRDISERIRLRDSLRLSHDALTRAQRVAKIGSWRLDVARDELTWTEESYRIFGIPLGTPMTYERFLERVHPEDRARVDERWKAALSGEPYDLEHRLVPIEGEVRWLREKADLEFDEQGRLVGGVGVSQDITEQKQANEAQRLWKERLDAIISTAADAIVSVDHQLRIVLFNEGAEAAFGWRREEVLGKELSVLLPERLRTVHRAHMLSFASGGVRARRMGERAHIVGQRKTGEEFPAEAAISQVEVGGQRLLTVTLRDVTERQRMEEALRSTEARLGVSLQAAPMVVFTQDLQLRYTWLHSSQTVPMPWLQVGKTDGELLAPALAAHLTEVKRQVLRTGKGAREQVRLARGSEVSVYDVTLEPTRDRSGRVVGLTGAAWEITDQKRQEDEQRFLAEVGSALMNAAPDFERTLVEVGKRVVHDLADYFVVDVVDEGVIRRLKVVHRNPGHAGLADALERMPLDRRRRHLTFQSLRARRSLLITEVDPVFLRSVAQTEQHLKVLEAIGPRSFISVPLIARDRLLGAFALISSSAGPRRYGTRELDFAEQLARLVALAVDNAQLYQARQRAIAARDELLGIVAHDLRTPLNLVLMQSDQLQRTSAPAANPARDPAATIRRAAIRMNRLIQDMLDVARLEAGSLALERAQLDPRAILEEVGHGQQQVAERLGQELVLEIAEALPQLYADRDRLFQVLENLLTNASKFTPRGGRIALGARRLGPDLLLWVSDNGAGIAPDALPHIFDRFWQASRVDRRGAGLGLAIVKGIVEAHGGRIWVRSTLGAGSTFYVALPAAAELTDLSPDRSPEAPGPH